jgi:hypothetical protein
LRHAAIGWSRKRFGHTANRTYQIASEQVFPMALDIYVFPSKTIENVRIGVNEGLWAVPVPTEARMKRQFATKALAMPIGAHGVFYCSGRVGSLTVPFIVMSRPDSKRIVRDVWNGAFFLPFRICPLGGSERWVRKSDVDRLLPTFRASEFKWHKLLRFRPNEVFLPSSLSSRDWEVLVQRLGSQSGQRSI